MVMKTNELIAELTEEKAAHAGCLRALASAQKGWGTAARRVQILEAKVAA